MAQGGPKQAPRDGEEGKKNDGFSRIDKRLAIRVLRESYTDAQREPLGRLLEYVAYEIEHTEK